MVKAILHEIVLNDKAWEPLGLFVGRRNELNRLEWILKSGQGSVTLIAGNRGSGKTTLIHAAAKAVRKMKARMRRSSLKRLGIFLWWAREDVVFVTIPLLPTNIENSEMRDTILRLIVKAVVSDWRSKNIYQKALLPWRYGYNIRKLDNLLRYKRILHTTQVGIQYKKVNAQRESEYEVDLTYADIELELGAFLKKFSKWVDFTIVFDELDKYEGRDKQLPPIKPHDYIRELKNLFTLSHAKFIFTSSEDYYHEIDETASENALQLHDYKFSLFAHKILIDRLDPIDFSTYFNSLVTNVDEELLLSAQIEPYQKLKYATMWLSELYPFSAKRILANMANTQDGGIGTIDLSMVDNDIGTFGGDIAGLQYIINHVYANHKLGKDSYFNQVLYRALQKVIQTFYSGREMKVNKSNLYGLLFSDFVNESRINYKAFLETEFYASGFGPQLDADVPFWVRKIENMRPSQRQILNDAITELVTLLDSLGLLHVEQDETSISFVSLDYQSHEYAIEELESIIDGVERDNRQLVSRREMLSRQIEAAARNAGLRVKQTELLTRNHNGQTASGMPFTAGWELPTLVSAENDMLELRQRELYDRATQKLKAAIESKYRKHYIGESIYRFGKDKYAILARATEHEIREVMGDESIKKVICINTSAKIKNKFRLKYFSFQTRTLSDYSKLEADINTYIADQLKTK